MFRVAKAAWMLLFSVLLHENTQAGVFELSAQGNYRKTYYDDTHYSAVESGTGSLGYYFWELSAIQLSYTRGAGTQIQPEYTIYQNFEAYGIDLLVTIAGRESAFKPYIKVGGAYVVKDLRTYVPNPGSNPTTYQTIKVQQFGLSPTAGIGFKLMLGQQFAIKFGADASTSPINAKKPNGDPEPTTYDIAFNAGISFLF